MVEAPLLLGRGLALLLLLLQMLGMLEEHRRVGLQH